MAISPARPEEFAQSSSGCFAISNGPQGKTALTSQKAFQLLSVRFGSNIIVKERNSNNIVFQLLKSVPSFNHIDSSLQSSVLVLQCFQCYVCWGIDPIPFLYLKDVEGQQKCGLPATQLLLFPRCTLGIDDSTLSLSPDAASKESSKLPLKINQS